MSEGTKAIATCATGYVATVAVMALVLLLVEGEIEESFLAFAVSIAPYFGVGLVLPKLHVRDREHQAVKKLAFLVVSGAALLGTSAGLLVLLVLR